MSTAWWKPSIERPEMMRFPTIPPGPINPFSGVRGPRAYPPGDAPPATVQALEPWQFQPDADTPGLYLQCATLEQREAVMRAMGWKSPVEPIPEKIPASAGNSSAGWKIPGN